MVEIARAGIAPARLGECPLWSPEEQVLWWVDIDSEQIHRYDPVTDLDEVRSTNGRPGSLARTASPGRLLVAIEHELVWFDWNTATSTPFVTLEDVGTGNRLNDGRCDSAGRFVVGSMYEDSSARKATGILHQVEGDGTSTVIRTGIGVTNGLAFDPDRGRAYFADSATGTVIMWDYDADAGQRHNERLFLDYADMPGKPDGACVDADGCYWSASVNGWAVIRVTPEGVVDRRIELPVQRPSMPAFGGSDLSTLFVTSIADQSEPGRDGFDPGALMIIDVGVQGVVDAPFNSDV